MTNIYWWRTNFADSGLLRNWTYLGDVAQGVLKLLPWRLEHWTFRRRNKLFPFHCPDNRLTTQNELKKKKKKNLQWTHCSSVIHQYRFTENNCVEDAVKHRSCTCESSVTVQSEEQQPTCRIFTTAFKSEIHSEHKHEYRFQPKESSQETESNLRGRRQLPQQQVNTFLTLTFHNFSPKPNMDI